MLLSIISKYTIYIINYNMVQFLYEAKMTDLKLALSSIS